MTICTKNRESFFGEIINGKMVLSKIGEIIEYEWKQTHEIRKNVELDEYIIMPDHMHGILFIKTVAQKKFMGWVFIISHGNPVFTNV